MRRFEAKVVLVTGAASGIGRATALRLGGEGARVACLDLKLDGARQTAHELRTLGQEADAIECDVSDSTAVKAAVARVVERFSGIDVLCNVAGILHSAHTHELRLEDWNRVLAVNLTGT